MNYIEQVIQSTASITEIDDNVVFWHTHDTGNSLQEFLGMSKEEFELWAKSGDDILNDIVYCRKNNLTINEYISRKINI